MRNSFLLICVFFAFSGSGCQPVYESSLKLNQTISTEVPPRPIDTLVVCAKDFQPALTEWIAYRTQQGRSIRVIEPRDDAESLTQEIRTIAEHEDLKFIFLVGDTRHKHVLARHPQHAGQPEIQLRSDLLQASTTADSSSSDSGSVDNTIPMHYVKAEVNLQFGSEDQIATDHPYADLNDDSLPDIAVGRLPAQSAAEVREFLRRVMDYEACRDSDQTWKRRVNFVAGVGGFGQVIDSTLEQVTKELITNLIPPEYEVAMTLGSWRSPFCPDPRKFEQTVIDRFNGCQFLVYIGHGLPDELGRLKLPDRVLPIFDCRSATQVDCTDGSPIAIFLACYTGAIDHCDDCISKVLLQQPGGPISIISGTRVTMPYGMSLMMLEFADSLYSGKIETLGELLQEAKRRMMSTQEEWLKENAATEFNDSNTDRLRRMVLGTGLALSPKPDQLTVECREHLYMMHLFGDPLLRLHYPQAIDLSVPSTATAGTTLRIQGTSPAAGKLCAELSYPRERFRKRPRYRKQYQGSDEALSSYDASYADANDLTWQVCIQQASAGKFEVNLPVPHEVSGECIIRCLLTGDQGTYALGSARITVSR